MIGIAVSIDAPKWIPAHIADRLDVRFLEKVVLYTFYVILVVALLSAGCLLGGVVGICLGAFGALLALPMCAHLLQQILARS